jgi:hypothetical protein
MTAKIKKKFLLTIPVNMKYKTRQKQVALKNEWRRIFKNNSPFHGSIHPPASRSIMVTSSQIFFFLKT